MGKQDAMKHSRCLGKARLVARPGLWCCTVGKHTARKHSICLSYVCWVASPYLVDYVVAALWRSNQQRRLQRKKGKGVLTGAVCSINKRLALHCIATIILPMQRIIPHTANQKQDKKMHLGLRQGQATRLSARCPAQRLATDWGRHTTTLNALKIGHFKQTFTDFNILPARYDTKKCIGASAKAKCRAFWHIARPSVWQLGGAVAHFRLEMATEFLNAVCVRPCFFIPPGPSVHFCVFLGWRVRMSVIRTAKTPIMGKIGAKIRASVY